MMKVVAVWLPILTAPLALAFAFLDGSANFTELCEEVRRADNLVIDPTTNTAFICGQTYSLFPPSAPAPPVVTNLETCQKHYPGFEISKPENLQQWAGPFFNFLIAALAFAASIPLGLEHYRQPPLPLLLDPIVSGALVLLKIGAGLGWAGPFLAGAIYEAWTDFRILGEIDRRLKTDIINETPDGKSAFLAMAICLLGACQMDDELYTSISTIMDTNSRITGSATIFLERLHTQYAPFGQTTGLPICFYIGAILFSTFDAKSRLGDNDTAHSLAFGLCYAVLPLVAIAASTVLGIGSTSVIEAALAERPDIGKRCKLTWLSARRVWLTEWTEKTGETTGYLHIVNDSSTARWSCAFAVVLLAIPCSLGIAVSYLTPKVGFSCRSLVLLVYLLVQATLTLLWLTCGSPKAREARCYVFWRRVAKVIYGSFGLASAIWILGATALQLSGVFRNCVCKAGFFHRHNPEETVQLATDTAEMRTQAVWWIYLGFGGAAYVFVLCFAGAIYQKQVRQRCSELIKRLAR